MVSLLTITFFAKRLVLKDERELMKNWPVIGLISSDTIMAFAHILIIGNAYAFEDGSYVNLCKLQGFLVHFGMQASFMWLNVLTLIMYNTLYMGVEVSKKRTVVLCFALPFAYCSMYGSIIIDFIYLEDSELRLRIKIIAGLKIRCLRDYSSSSSLGY
jgi:7 transmembrane receptor (Secretin family)